MRVNSVKQYYDMIAPFYDDYIQDIQSHSEVSDIVSMIRSVAQPPCEVLDVGCGSGRISIMLQELGYRAVGLDISPRMIQSARNNGLDEVHVADFLNSSELCHLKNRFDLLISIRMGHSYVHDPLDSTRIAENCAMVLRDGGAIIWDTPNLEHWGPEKVLECSPKYSQLQETIELVCFPHSATEISSVFCNCGFKIKRIYSSFKGDLAYVPGQRVIINAYKPNRLRNRESSDRIADTPL